MEVGEESLRIGSNLRTLSSSSSAFFSANQSPFFSPKSPSFHSTIPSEDVCPPVQPSCSSSDPRTFDNENEDFDHRKTPKNVGRNQVSAFTPTSTSYSSTRITTSDIYIGFHGRKPLLLRFTNWLRAELEVQGLSCFVTDRAKCRTSRKHSFVAKAMDASTFGVIILTRKSFKNPYTIEEIRFFSSKNNLVPIYFDVGPDECLVRDIIERRGEWERHGGEVWVRYGGSENEWREAVSRLGGFDEWKLEAQDGKWRDCILRAVTILATKLGRRSVVDRLTKWREKIETEEFPFLRNENFVGRKNEISEIEFMLFGDVNDSGGNYFEIKAKSRRKNLKIGYSKDEKRRKGKEHVVWKESKNEIEMQNSQKDGILPNPKKKNRKRSTKVVYGKGIACVSGDSGIGKTELLLEFAYRFHQRYKMVLWIGGESRYIRQNYLNLSAFLEVDVGVENGFDKSRIKSFEKHEEAAIARVRRELSRNIPFLIIIDNLDSEKDFWDHKNVMDLLPRFGGETHVIISTRLSRIMNIEPLKLSYLSGIEAMTLMQGNVRDYSVSEIDALRAIEEKLGRLTLGLTIVGAILSELPINPSRLLDTINRMPVREISLTGRESQTLRRNVFVLQLIEVCFSIFDHADGPRSLATNMVLASGWFAPGPVPVPLLTLAGKKMPEKHRRSRIWKNVFRSLTCGCSSFYNKSESEACSILIRFSIARGYAKDGFLHFNELTKLYGRKRGVSGVPRAVVRAVVERGSTTDQAHVWAVCFMLMGFGTDSTVVETEVSELPFLAKEVILPLAIKTFVAYSRCTVALELLRLCTDALEAADEALVAPVEKWLDKPLCWKPVQTDAQMDPGLWQELALARAMVLEVRAKLMLRGGQFDIGDDLIRKAIFIRTSISGEHHPDTISARQTLSKIPRLLADYQSHTSP